MSRALTCTTEELTQAFTLVALYNGNAERAAKELPWKADTLRRWRRKHRDLYEKIRVEIEDTKRGNAIEDALASAFEARQVADEAIERSRRAMASGEIPEREVYKVARDMAVIYGIYSDKALKLMEHGAPKVNININLDETVRGLAAKGAKFYDDQGNELSPEQVIEGTAEEVTDAPGTGTPALASATA